MPRVAGKAGHGRCRMLTAPAACPCSFNGCKKAVDEFREKRGIPGQLMFQTVPDNGDGKFEAAWWLKE